MELEEAYNLIEKAVAAGRPANGYLVVGALRGMAGELAERVLRLLFGEGDLRAHPDVHRLAPEKKSRIISVDAVRTRLVDPVGATAFKGGWKAGVIYGADPALAGTFVVTDLQVAEPGGSSVVRSMIRAGWDEIIVAPNTGGVSIRWT